MAANEEGRAGKSASIRPIVAGATFAARDKSCTVQRIAARAIRNCAPDTTIRAFDNVEASFWVKDAIRRGTLQDSRQQGVAGDRSTGFQWQEQTTRPLPCAH
jgi:hypothetical protein